MDFAKRQEDNRNKAGCVIVRERSTVFPGSVGLGRGHVQLTTDPQQMRRIVGSTTDGTEASEARQTATPSS